MVQRLVTQFVDDLDGKQINDGEGGEVRFSIDSDQYVIDLSDDNKRKLLDALAPFVAKARKDQGRSRTRRSTPTGTSAAVMREWARENGLDVPAKGRIPANIREAYNSRK